MDGLSNKIAAHTGCAPSVRTVRNAPGQCVDETELEASQDCAACARCRVALTANTCGGRSWDNFVTSSDVRDISFLAGLRDGKNIDSLER
jgi:flavoprotein